MIHDGSMLEDFAIVELTMYLGVIAFHCLWRLLRRYTARQALVLLIFGHVPEFGRILSLTPRRIRRLFNRATLALT